MVSVSASAGGALVSCVVGLPSSVAGVPAPPTARRGRYRAADGQSSALAARGSAAQGWAPSSDAECPALAQAGAADGRSARIAAVLHQVASWLYAASLATRLHQSSVQQQRGLW